MKKSLLIVLVTMVVTLLVTLFIFELKAQRDQLQADKIENIDSVILKESRQLLIHLPKNYKLNSDKKYPVLYALDGTSHDQDVLNATAILSAAEQLPAIIVVGILNENRNADLTPNYMTVGKDPTEFGRGALFLEYLEKEVIPLLDENFRTTETKMLSGHSRAGMFTFFALLEKPSLFDAYFCYSPAFWRNEHVIVQKAKEKLQRPVEFNQFVYLSLGENENDKMKKGFNAMVELLGNKDSTNLKSFYKYTSNANHQTNAFYSIPHALMKWQEEQ